MEENQIEQQEQLDGVNKSTQRPIFTIVVTIVAIILAFVSVVGVILYNMADDATADTFETSETTVVTEPNTQPETAETTETSAETTECTTAPVETSIPETAETIPEETVVETTHLVDILPKPTEPTTPLVPIEPKPTEPLVPIETKPSEPVEETECTEVTEPSETAEVTESTEITEMTEPDEMVETTEVTEPIESSEPTSAPETEETTPAINRNDVELLACVIYQEAGADYICDTCRRRVADVVLNRVMSPLYPNTIYGVLTQYCQYGRFYWTGVVWPASASYAGNAHAVARAYRIAEEVLSGQHSDLYGGGWIGQAEFPSGSEQIYHCGIYFGR